MNFVSEHKYWFSIGSARERLSWIAEMERQLPLAKKRIFQLKGERKNLLEENADLQKRAKELLDKMVDQGKIEKILT